MLSKFKQDVLKEYYHSYVEQLEKEHDALLLENKNQRQLITRLRNKNKGVSASVLEEDNARLREQCKKYLQERNMYRKLYKKEKQRKGD